MGEEVRKIQISNEKLWKIAERGEDIDQWLREHVGYGNYKEWIGFTALPYRSFSFTYPKHEVMFILRWL